MAGQSRGGLMVNVNGGAGPAGDRGGASEQQGRWWSPGLPGTRRCAVELTEQFSVQRKSSVAEAVCVFPTFSHPFYPPKVLSPLPLVLQRGDGVSRGDGRAAWLAVGARRRGGPSSPRWRPLGSG